MAEAEPQSGPNNRSVAATSRSTAVSHLRPIVLGVLLGVALTVAGLVIYISATRQGAPRLTNEAYEAAVKRWDAHSPADYELDIDLTGNRPSKIHVEVHGGEVMHMTRDGVEPAQQRTWYYWSVPGMLDTIGQELEMARDPAKSLHNPAATEMVMWAEFDPLLGYPVRYDRVVLGADFEVHWRVTRFQTLGESP